MVMWGGKGGNFGGKGWGGNGGKGGGKMAAMMQIMQMMADGGMGGMDAGDWGWDSTDAGDAAQNMTWKSKLTMALQKKRKSSLTKDEIKYEVNEVEGGYQAGVTLDEETYIGEISKSKKDAEHAAAREACKQLFPELKAGQGQKAGQGKKRKAEEMKKVPMPLAPKSKLRDGVQLLKPEGPLTKQDITFETEEQDGKFVSTVTIKVKGKSFKGEPSANPKEAEHSASTVAYNALKSEIEPLEAERAEKKAKKNKESLAALKERTAAKLAEKKEAKAAKEGGN